MKKFYSLLLMVAISALLTACGKFTCEMCGKESSGGKTVEIMGENAKVCDDCYKEIKELQDAFK